MSKSLLQGLTMPEHLYQHSVLDTLEMKWNCSFWPKLKHFIPWWDGAWIGEQIDGPEGLSTLTKKNWKQRCKVYMNSPFCSFNWLWQQSGYSGWKRTQRILRKLIFATDQSFLQLKELKSFLVTANSKQLFENLQFVKLYQNAEEVIENWKITANTWNRIAVVAVTLVLNLLKLNL